MTPLFYVCKVTLEDEITAILSYLNFAGHFYGRVKGKLVSVGLFCHFKLK